MDGFRFRRDLGLSRPPLPPGSSRLCRSVQADHPRSRLVRPAASVPHCRLHPNLRNIRKNTNRRSPSPTLLQFRTHHLGLFLGMLYRKRINLRRQCRHLPKSVLPEAYQSLGQLHFRTFRVFHPGHLFLQLLFHLQVLYPSRRTIRFHLGDRSCSTSRPIGRRIGLGAWVVDVRAHRQVS